MEDEPALMQGEEPGEYPLGVMPDNPMEISILVVAGRRLTGCANCHVRIVVKKESWPRRVLFEGATQTSNFGSEPVFSDLAFRHRVHSLTYLTLVLTVVSGEQPMYEWQHDLSAYGSVHGWVDLRPLHPDKNNAKDTKDGKDGKDSKNSKNSNSDAPPQLNLSLEFQVHSGPLHLIMLRPYMSTADLQEVARQSKGKTILSPTTEMLHDWLSRMSPPRPEWVSCLRLMLGCLLIIAFYVVPGVLLFGYRMGA